MKELLLVIDIQNDFCCGGALEVPNGSKIIPVINKILPKFSFIVFTQDWHNSSHLSFSCNYKGKRDYDIVMTSYGKQVLWPSHCVAGSEGAEFHSELSTKYAHLILRKGWRDNVDSYSAFYENDRKTSTGLLGYCRELGISKIWLCGLALDFCVYWSALDALKEGFQVGIIYDAVKGIDINGSVDLAYQDLKKRGTEFILSSQL